MPKQNRNKDQRVEWRRTDSLRLHPEAERVPRMNREQFTDFVEDIRERGIVVPLEVIDDEIILDGRTRWLAAKELRLDQVPVVSANLGKLNPVIFMLRAASHRRHLTDDQRACLAQEELMLLAGEGRQRRAEAGAKARAGKSREPKSQPLGSSSASRDRSTDARTIVAGTYGISERRVRDAQRLQREVPNLFEKVRSGEVRLAVARREAERNAKRQRHHELIRSASTQPTSPSWNIIIGDAVESMRQMQAGSVRLAFADPLWGGLHNGSSVAHSVMWRSHVFLAVIGVSHVFYAT